MIDPSKLNRKILVQRKKKERNEYQEVEDTWKDLFNCSAQVIPLSGREVFRSDRISGIENLRFIIHFRKDIIYEDRIFYNGKNYNIRNIAELGLREGLEILAEAIDVQA